LHLKFAAAAGGIATMLFLIGVIVIRTLLRLWFKPGWNRSRKNGPNSENRSRVGNNPPDWRAAAPSGVCIRAA